MIRGIWWAAFVVISALASGFNALAEWAHENYRQIGIES